MAACLAACLAACPAPVKPVWRRWNAARPTQSLNAWNCAPVQPAMLQRFVAGSYLPPFCTAHRHGMLEQLRAKATELVPISDMLTAAMRMKPFQIMVAPLSLDVGSALRHTCTALGDGKSPRGGLVLLSQKVATNDEENHLFGKIHFSDGSAENGSAKIE